MADTKYFDSVIIGAGPAGLTAGIYCTRAGLNTLVIEESAIGGQTIQSEEIDNYPGFKAISGYELSEKMHEHAESLGVKFLYDSINNIEIKDKNKVINTMLNGRIVAKAIILAMGAKAKKLGVERENEFIGKGINFCATCDGMFYRDKEVVVVGGGNAGVEEAIALSKQAKKVTLISKENKLNANISRVERLNSQKNAKVIFNAEITKIIGDKFVQGFEITELSTKNITTIKADGVFVSIGRVPSSGLVKGIVDIDEIGYVVVNDALETSEKGIFAAGDIRKKRLRQIIVSCADGAVAADSLNRYLLG